MCQASYTFCQLYLKISPSFMYVPKELEYLSIFCHWFIHDTKVFCPSMFRRFLNILFYLLTKNVTFLVYRHCQKENFLFTKMLLTFWLWQLLHLQSNLLHKKCIMLSVVEILMATFISNHKQENFMQGIFQNCFFYVLVMYLKNLSLRYCLLL